MPLREQHQCDSQQPQQYQATSTSSSLGPHSALLSPHMPYHLELSSHQSQILMPPHIPCECHISRCSLIKVADLLVAFWQFLLNIARKHILHPGIPLLVKEYSNLADLFSSAIESRGYSQFRTAACFRRPIVQFLHYRNLSTLPLELIERLTVPQSKYAVGVSRLPFPFLLT